MSQSELEQRALAYLTAILTQEDSDDFESKFAVAWEDVEIPGVAVDESDTPETAAYRAMVMTWRAVIPLWGTIANAYQHLALAHDAGSPKAALELLREYALEVADRTDSL